MIREYLLHVTLLLRFVFYGIEVLQTQVANGICRLELERWPDFGGEDAEQHLHAMLKLFWS